MTSAFSLAPLFRHSVGFDRLNDLFEAAQRNEGTSYPPYNMEKVGDDAYRIVIAVAGFHQDELELNVERGVLSVQGRKAERSEEGVTYLHQGIAQRGFRLQFRLADHIEVQGAKLEHGLLRIELKRIVPEEAKLRQIPINA